MTISSDDPRPPRVQMADALRREIQDGRLPPGARVPSIRALAAQFGVSPNTAQAGIDILKLEGRLETHGNRGTFVSIQPDCDDDPISQPSPVITLEALASIVRDLSGRLERLEDEVRNARVPAQ